MDSSKISAVLIVFFLMMSLQLACARPPKNDTQQRKGADDPVVVAAEEGADIILTKQQNDTISRNGGRFRRRTDLISPWPNNHVVFEIVDIHESLKPLVYQAVADWSRDTCITFEEYDYVDQYQDRLQFVFTENGCYSYLGYTSGLQPISLANSGCSHISVILHELGHALGLAHEQTRPDRDDYIQVLEENIEDGYHSQYAILDLPNDENVPYDVGSIMHYSQWTFSKVPYNDEFSTMIAHDPLKHSGMGQHGRLSHIDKMYMNKHYNCMDHCTPEQLAQICQYGGFVGKDCVCVCPEGLEGPLCDSMTPSPSPGCGGHFTEDNGEVFSPNYPSTYPDNSDCNYFITAPEGYRIELTFQDFSVEEDAYCYWDQLYIQHDSPMYDTSSADFCGTSLSQTVINSINNTIYMRFHSDDWFSETGFHASYRFIDSTSPELTCPSHRLYTTSIVNYESANVTDNSGEELTVICTPHSGSAFAIGTTQVVCSASDAANNTGSCTFGVSVQSVTAPQIVCPPAQTTSADSSHYDAFVKYEDANATDSNGVSLPVVCTPASDTLFGVGTTQVMCSAVDGSGNAGTCSFDITVTDDEAPELSCPPQMTVTANPGALSAVVTFDNAVVSDNSGDHILAVCSPASGSSFDIGTALVQCSASDASGNQDLCNFQVTIEAAPILSTEQPNDVQPPVLTCPPSQWIPAIPGTATATVSFNVTDVQDNTDLGLIATCQPSSSSVFPIGTTHVICSATDLSANTGECGFNITITDEEPPHVTCPDKILTSADFGKSYAPVTFNAIVATDNSGETLTTICFPESGSTFALGNTTVTCSAWDASHNLGLCNFDVNVIDVEAPVLSCPDSVVRPTDAGKNTAMFLYDPAAVTDNSGESLYAICTPMSHSLFGIGSHTIMCSALDSANNRGTCYFMVSIEDHEAPVITCPPSLSVEVAPPSLSAIVDFLPPSVLDNSRENITSLCFPDTGMEFPLGVSHVTCYATDSFGNSDNCDFNITVSESSNSNGAIHVPAIGGCGPPGQRPTNWYFDSLQSENYPGPYANYDDCRWKIDVPDGYYAYLWFERFDVESWIEYDFCFDYLTITTFHTNRRNKRTSNTDVYCGQELPPDVCTDDDIIINLDADNIITWTGFLLHYRILDTKPGVWDSWSAWSTCSATCGSGYKQRTRVCPTSDCVGPNSQATSCDLHQCPIGCQPAIEHNVTSSGGRIRSPGYPFQYPRKYFISRWEPCSVNVNIPDNMSVTFSFEDLDLTSSTSCYFDYLLFNSPSRTKEICGNDRSQTLTFFNGPIEVIFHTDNGLLYDVFSRGFDMKYTYNVITA
ncbi:uncharacterized protein LOC117108641 [Anneissia japonica]|uniref:uncharacterized protein LOC117108641 n=1 Tax=Anneissia japonica TaxID=1529436 RepID=UPI001425B6FD|nr:uncharacterized protein LOC117108641 [Anneissia japonica]